MVGKDRHNGEKALIVSTGPSITNKKVMKQIKKMAKKSVVFGLKESIPYLRERGVKVTYSVSMDPGGERQVKRTPIDKNVTYCLASSCHPMLYDHLLESQCKIEVFHSACGHVEPDYEPGILIEYGVGEQTKYSIRRGTEIFDTEEGYPFCSMIPLLRTEVDVYHDLFGCADTMQGGFTVTNRTLALAKYMGFSDITMAGTDFGWRNKGGSHYSDLVKVPSMDDNFMEDHGVVDGTPWFTRPDQLASACDVARRIKKGEVKVIGDSLAVALSKRDDSFLDKVVQLK
jgi:hypothetical protein